MHVRVDVMPVAFRVHATAAVTGRVVADRATVKPHAGGGGHVRPQIDAAAVAGGVAVGIALGVAKLVLNFDLMQVLLPLYAIGVLLTVFSTEEFVNVAWDSAGVTTGPVTVPLVLAMGLGLGSAVSAIEGFGILSLASICPIVAVLSMGIFIRLQHKFSAQPATK